MEENTTVDISAVNEKIAQESAFIDLLLLEMNKVIVGQKHMVERLLIGLLGQGHILLEGVPGLAKTLAINTLAKAVKGEFSRIQFTPDLLPADVVGTMIYNMKVNDFSIKKGPIFANFVLADEINRAPAKVQSALLEAMAERQVSIGKRTYQLPELFLVMATQNPFEQEGTYPLPEAQLDRFLLHVNVDYPGAEAEQKILQLVRNEFKQLETAQPPAEMSQSLLFTARQEVLNLHMDAAVEQYIVQIIIATRQPQAYDEQLASWIDFGVSPRATIALDRCARAHAWLAGKDYVSPDDVQAVVHDVLRHRLLLSFEAEASGLSKDDITDRIIELVPVS